MSSKQKVHSVINGSNLQIKCSRIGKAIGCDSVEEVMCLYFFPWTSCRAD